MICVKCNKHFINGENVIGFDRYDSVYHYFIFDFLNDKISIEFSEELQHVNCNKLDNLEV